jgi:hypothetical protein
MRFHSLVWIALLWAVPSSADAATVTLADSTFAAADWTNMAVVDTATADSRYFYPQLNSDQAWAAGHADFHGTGLHMFFVQYYSDDQRLLIVNNYVPGVYDPSVSGAIKSVRYSVDFAGDRHDSNQFGDFRPVLKSGLVLEQDGAYYVTNLLSFDNSPQWFTLTDAGFEFPPPQEGKDADDFWPYYGSGLHPDFSSAGGPIQFGYLVDFTDDIRGPGSSVGNVYVDNWRVDLEIVPEPAARKLIAAILAALPFAGSIFPRRSTA